VREGTYEIQSERSGYALELAVDFVRMPGSMRFFGGKIEEPVGRSLPRNFQMWKRGGRKEKSV
jgi:arabinan endo-1,5-alpha-L-arabinosidase